MAVEKVVQVDSKGQIVIPKAIRNNLKIEQGDAFWISVVNREISLQKIQKPKSPKTGDK